MYRYIFGNPVLRATAHAWQSLSLLSALPESTQVRPPHRRVFLCASSRNSVEYVARSLWNITLSDVFRSSFVAQLSPCGAKRPERDALELQHRFGTGMAPTLRSCTLHSSHIDSVAECDGLGWLPLLTLKAGPTVCTARKQIQKRVLQDDWRTSHICYMVIIA